MPLSCSQPDCSYATEDVAENLADMLDRKTIKAISLILSTALQFKAQIIGKRGEERKVWDGQQ